MNEEEKLQLENECLLKYSKAQMIQKYIDELEENCTLSDLWYKSQEETKRLNNIINEVADEMLKELNENNHLSYGVALALRQKLISYKEIRDSDTK